MSIRWIYLWIYLCTGEFTCELCLKIVNDWHRFRTISDLFTVSEVVSIEFLSMISFYFCCCWFYTDYFVSFACYLLFDTIFILVLVDITFILVQDDTTFILVQDDTTFILVQDDITFILVQDDITFILVQDDTTFI